MAGQCNVPRGPFADEVHLPVFRPRRECQGDVGAVDAQDDGVHQAQRLAGVDPPCPEPEPADVALGDIQRVVAVADARLVVHARAAYPGHGYIGADVRAHRAGLLVLQPCGGFGKSEHAEQPRPDERVAGGVADPDEVAVYGQLSERATSRGTDVAVVYLEPAYRAVLGVDCARHLGIVHVDLSCLPVHVYSWREGAARLSELRGVELPVVGDDGASRVLAVLGKHVVSHEDRRAYLGELGEEHLRAQQRPVLVRRPHAGQRAVGDVRLGVDAGIAGYPAAPHVHRVVQHDDLAVLEGERAAPCCLRTREDDGVLAHERDRLAPHLHRALAIAVAHDQDVVRLGILRGRPRVLVSGYGNGWTVGVQHALAATHLQGEPGGVRIAVLAVVRPEAYPQRGGSHVVRRKRQGLGRHLDVVVGRGGRYLVH